MGKTVLFIRTNPVMPDSRVEKEVSALVAHGFEVSVLAWDRSDNYSIRKEALNDSVKTVNTYRVGIKSPYGSGIKNLKNLVKFQTAIRHFLRTNTFDVVHACDFDTAFTAYHTINHKKTRFVYDIFDYYADAFNIPQCLKNIIIALDRQIINNADLTILCTEERREQIAGTSPQSLIIIHNTPDDNCISIDFNNKTIENNRRPRICYVGILQPGRLLAELGNVLREHHELELHIGGFGKYEEYFAKLSDECENVKYYGKMPYNKTLELESDCDIMLAIYDPSSRNHRYAAPNKFYEALMLGKPLIMVQNTGMASVVQENRIGCLIEYSAESLLKGIRELVAKRQTWTEIASRERQLYNQDYSWAAMEKRLIDGYRKLFI